MKFLRLGKTDEALNLLVASERELMTSPTHSLSEWSSTLSKLGTYYQQTEEWELALEYFQKVADLDVDEPLKHRTQLKIAEISLIMHKPSATAKLCRQVLDSATEPELVADAHLLLGHACLRLRKQTAATSHFYTALALQKEHSLQRSRAEATDGYFTALTRSSPNSKIPKVRGFKSVTPCMRKPVRISHVSGPGQSLFVRRPRERICLSKVPSIDSRFIGVATSRRKGIIK